MRMVALLSRLATGDATVAVPAPVVAQAWRGGGPRQARTARLLAADAADVIVLDLPTAKAVGALAAHVRATDVVDVAVVLCARERGHRVISADPDDLHAIDPDLAVEKP